LGKGIVLKKYKIFIQGPLPGLNEIINTSKTLVRQAGKKRIYKYTEMKKNITTSIARLFLLEGIPKMKSIVIEYTWIEPNAKRDPDNVEAGTKFILDGLVLAGIIENDGRKQIKKSSHQHAISKDNPGVIVKIQEVEK